MSLRMVFGRDDPARTRFVVSPLFETMAALRVLLEPGRQRYHLPWLEAVRPEVEQLDLRPLLALSPRHGWTPDFLNPAPAGPGTGVSWQLAQVNATPDDQVAREIERSLTERGGEPAPPDAWQLLDDPAASRALLTGLLEQCWRLLIEPHWPRLREFLDADVAYRTQTLADYGLERVLADLHPRARWTGQALILQGFEPGRCLLRGTGLLLMPSVFLWPSLAPVIDPPSRRPWPTRPGASPSCGSRPGPCSRTRWPGCWAGPGPRCSSRWPSPPRPTPWPGGTAWPRAPCPSTSRRCGTPGWSAAGGSGTRLCTSRPGWGRHWPPADQQRLGTHAQPPLGVRQDRGGQARPAGGDSRLRV